MQCPNCQSANPAQANFCMACGFKLTNIVVCSTCATILPGYARFCYNCGMVILHQAAQAPAVQQASTTIPQQPAPPPAVPAVQQAPIAAPAVPTQPPPTPPALTGELIVGHLVEARPLLEMQDDLQRFLPEALYDPLERRPSQEHLEKVRHHLAALLAAMRTYLPRPVFMAPQPVGVPAGGMYRGVFLFGDVSGFTPLSEQLKKLGKAGAERITEIINELFSDMVKVLFDHGGTLLKFGGDALLGLFPAETDAEMAEGAVKAVQAGLAMQTAMQKFSAIEAAGVTRALKIKCGISSGPYFAAHIGTEPEPEKNIRGTMAYVTTGHTVNRAEQAEGHAYPGQVVMTQGAFDLLGDRVVATQVGQDEIPGTDGELEPDALGDLSDEDRGKVAVGPVSKEPDPGYYRVRCAPPTEDTQSHVVTPEPPEGEVMAQITYLLARIDRLSHYLPETLVGRMASSPSPDDVRMPAEHRPVTVMFANYKGISDLIEDMGDTQPDIIIQQLNKYFVHMAKVVEKYEGTVARMDQYAVGDRLVIFFGAPRAHEDDPVRAVYTALEMQAAVREHFAALQTEIDIYRFEQRIGINTGHLFAGNAGAPNLRQEYTLMGDDINMAARLMSNAGWQQIYISQKTQEQLGDFFDLSDMFELKVKGKQILIPTFEVVGRADPGQARSSASASPLTGRTGEMATLARVGQSFAGGRGQIIACIGDGGLGKSRLVREFEAHLRAQDPDEHIHWIKGQALSFTENVNNWLITQIMRGALKLGPSAKDDDVIFTLSEKTKEFLGRENARDAFPLLATMMGLELVGGRGDWVKALNPRVRRKQTSWALREFFSAAATDEQPIAVVLDDLHWADEASLGLLEDVIEVIEGAPLMFCLLFRRHTDKGCWRLRNRAESNHQRRYTELALSALNESDSQALLQALRPGAGFPADVMQEILGKAAGNPFYLEEVIRSLTDSGALTEVEPGKWEIKAEVEIKIPDSLQGAITARIDRLTLEARQALQMASVIGREFQEEVLKSLAKADSKLNQWLSQLERSDLIQETDGDDEYIFPDALVQEVAYDNLLMKRRKGFHLEIGMTLLEEISPDQIEKECEILAYHFSRSDDHKRAAKYLEMSGHKAQAEFSNGTAVEMYTYMLARLNVIQKEDPAPDDWGDPDDTRKLWEKRFDAMEKRQQIYGLLGQQDEREGDLLEMMDLAETHKADMAEDVYEARRSDVLNDQADFYQSTGNYHEAKAAAEAARDIKRKLGDAGKSGLAKAISQLGVLAYYQGDYTQARPLLNEAVALQEEADDPEGRAWSIMFLGMIYLFEDNYSAAAERHQQASDIAKARQDMFQVGVHLTNAARVALRRGEYEQALEQFEKSLEMKIRTGDRMGQGFSLFSAGMAHIYLERYDEAEDALQRSHALRQAINDERGLSYCLYGLGLVALGRAQPDQAEDYFQQAYEAHSNLGLRGETVADLSYLGQARLEQGKLAAALEASQKAIELAENTSVQEIQQIYLNHSRVLARQGDGEAGAYLQKAYDTMMQQAELVGGPEARQAFLEKVKVNQEIVAEAAEEAA